MNWTGQVLHITSEDNKIGLLSEDHPVNEGSGVEVRTRNILGREHIQARCGLAICIVHICHLQYLEFSILVKPQLQILLLLWWYWWWVRLFRRQDTHRNRGPKPWWEREHHHQNHEIRTHLPLGAKNVSFTRNRHCFGNSNLVPNRGNTYQNLNLFSCYTSTPAPWWGWGLWEGYGMLITDESSSK